MGKYIQLLVLLCAIAGSQAHARTGDNPFDKVKRVFAGAGSDWSLQDDTLSKRSQNESGLFYHLVISDDSLQLLLTSRADADSRKRFKSLVIEDMRIDGRRMPVFTWCLQNQESQQAFLQQGLKVKMDICSNLGETGEFRVRINNQTMRALENGKRLSFLIKPYRSAIEVNFDIENFSDALAIMEMEKLNEQAALAAAAAAALPKPPPLVPVLVKQQAVVMCDATAPDGFDNIKARRYVCDDSADKARAEGEIADAVNKEKQRRARIAEQREQLEKQREQERQLALMEEKKKQQALLQQQQQEDAAIAASRQKHEQVWDAFTKKMVGVCNKMWARGKHRCYCERYIEHAPPGIQSDPTCNSET